jgi:hypothetical protein
VCSSDLAVVSLPLMAARILAGPHRSIAAVLALSAAILATLILPARALRGLVRRLGQTGLERWFISSLAVAAAIAALAGVAEGWLVLVPHWAIPLALVAAGGAGAAALTAVRGVGLHRAAEFVDAQVGLDERLATAVEVARRHGDQVVGQAVREQAAEAVRARRPLRLPYWRRTRLTPSVLGLSLLACALLAAIRPLEAPGLAEGRRRQSLLVEVAQAVTARAGEVRQQADAADSDALRQQAEQLNRLGQAIAADKVPPAQAISDLEHAQQELRAKLADKELAGRIIHSLEQQKRRLASAGGTDAGEVDKENTLAAIEGEKPTAPPEGRPETRSSSTRPGVEESPGAWARVFVPAGAEAPQGGRSGVGPVGESRPVAAGAAAAEPYVGLDQAWVDARRRAAESISEQRLPLRLRGLIRSYYGEGE